jgi:hypothetical protein
MIVTIRPRLTRVPPPRPHYVIKSKTGLEVRSHFINRHIPEELRAVPLGEGWVRRGRRIAQCDVRALRIIVKLNKEHVVRDGANDAGHVPRALWGRAEIVCFRCFLSICRGKRPQLRNEGRQMLGLNTSDVDSESKPKSSTTAPPNGRMVLVSFPFPNMF